MKQFKLIAVLTAFLFTGLLSAQDNIGSSISNNQPSEFEKGKETYHESDAFYPVELDVQLKAAQESGNTIEANRLINEINSKIPAENKFNSIFNANDDRPATEIQPPFNQDWDSTDATVFIGAVIFIDTNFSKIDIHMGKDGSK